MAILKFNQQHLSIKPFEDVELPQFSIITGLNGSGKTHLLKAIDGGQCSIGSVHPQDVQYFSYVDFLAKTSPSLNAHQLRQQKDQAWAFWTGAAGNPKVNWKNSAQKIASQHLSADLGLTDERLTRCWEDDPADTSAQASALASYREAINTQIFANPNWRKLQHWRNMQKAMIGTGLRLHVITRLEWDDRFVPYGDATGSPLSMGIGAMFTDYMVKRYLAVHDQWELTDQKKSKAEMFREFEDKHPAPWVLVNEILDSIYRYADGSVFNFQVTTPEGQSLKLENWSGYTFQPMVVDREFGVPRDFSALSSGEQVLLALAISVLESRQHFQMPEVLLLDEVDATLHPSMMRAMIMECSLNLVPRSVGVLIAPLGQGQHHHDQTTQTAFA